MKYFSIKSVLSELKSDMRQFGKDRSGNVILIFALALIPMLGAIGAAIDYSNAAQIRQKMQNAVDAGVLAAVGARPGGQATPTTAQVIDSVKAYITANLAGSTVFSTPVINASVNGNVVSADITVDVPTSFMKVLGISKSTVHVAASSQAATTNPVSVEVALVLDTTGSMGDNNKLAGAQTAATALLDQLMPAATTNTASNDPAAKVHVSLVPFSYYVNVGTQYAGASWLGDTTTYSTTASSCQNTYPNEVLGAPYSYTYDCSSDGVPKTCTGTKQDIISLGNPVVVCGPQTKTYTWGGCVGSRNYPLDMTDTVTSSNVVPPRMNQNCANPLQRLDSRNSTISTQIAALTPWGETYIAPGLLWGWRTVSPNPPFADGQPYSKNVYKYIVLMTDGFNTHSPDYPGHELTDTTTADALTLETCTAIKKAGVTIYAVSFEVYNNTSAPMLQACSSGPGNYFNATDNAGLLTSFQAIANSIIASANKPRLVK